MTDNVVSPNTIRRHVTISHNRWRARYLIIDAMLDEFDKEFSLFAVLISSNMAKISLLIESLENGYTSP